MDFCKKGESKMECCTKKGCFFTCKFLVSYKKAIYIGPVKDKDTSVSKRILKAEQIWKIWKSMNDTEII